MKLERKVELLKQSYMDGYTSEFFGIEWGFEYFKDAGIPQDRGEDTIVHLYKNHKEIQDHYNQIVPFYEITQEMTAEDWDDFAILFKVREVLPRFKKFLDEYTNFLRENNYHAPKESEIMKRYDDIHADWFDANYYQGMDLKKIIRKYVPTFPPEPTPEPK